MSWKLWDFECGSCGSVNEYMVEGAPSCIREECKGCHVPSGLTRILVAKPAAYMGEKVRAIFNPQVHGGKYDTMGGREIPKLPELEGVAELDTKMAEASAAGATRQEVNDQFHKDMPNSSDYKGLFATKEWQAASKERKARASENKARAARAALVKEGKMNTRDVKLPGDAKELHK